MDSLTGFSGELGGCLGSWRFARVQCSGFSSWLLARLAFLTIHHGFDAARFDLFRGVFLLGSTHYGGFLDVAALSCSQVVGGF